MASRSRWRRQHVICDRSNKAAAHAEPKPTRLASHAFRFSLFWCYPLACDVSVQACTHFIPVVRTLWNPGPECRGSGPAPPMVNRNRAPWEKQIMRDRALE